MLIFDMDGTICKSKQKITSQMKKKLEKLGIVVISGASKKQMEYQLDGLNCTIMGQNGNDTSLWQNKLTDQDKKEIYYHIEKYGLLLNGLVDDRGCQISYSCIGHNKDHTLKKNFDPKQVIRKAILKQHPFKSKNLTAKIAGTTCFDYINKKGTKGDNLKRWLKENKISAKDCVYYGDALFKGGNDASVIGIMKCVKVKSPQDLLTKLNKI